MAKFQLYDFLKRYNSAGYVKCFLVFEAALQITLIALTLARAIYDGLDWSYLVFVINLINFFVLAIDARYFSFGNALSLFFVITSESIALGANIMICFVGERLLRATSMFVLVLWFLQKGSFASFLMSTILRSLNGMREQLNNMSMKRNNDDDTTAVMVNGRVRNTSDTDDSDDERLSSVAHNAFA